MSDDKADIGLTGLAVMGSNLARNMARNGHKVAVHNRTTEKMQRLLDRFGEEAGENGGGFVGSESLEDFVASIEKPRAIVIMVKAGEATDAVVDELVPLLDEGDIVVDAGNAHVDDTIRRQEALQEKGLHFVGMGVSGGEEGALKGPSIMVGGSDHAYERLGPIVEKIAAQVDGTPCAAHLGPDGAGHFVKMVHNGIEYSDMQSLGEAYDLLRNVAGLEPSAIADVFADWNEGRLGSFLLEIAVEVLRHEDADTGKPFVDVVVDAAEQKGTGRWTVQTALDLGVPVTGTAEATFARAVSGHVEQRGPVREAYGPPESDADVDSDHLVAGLEQAVYGARVVAYAQGFDQILAASREHDWDVDPVTVATIWRGGCIIRAKLLEEVRTAFAEDAERSTLLTHEPLRDAILEADEGWRRTVVAATESGVPIPVIGSALSYVDALRRDRLPAALVQGLRDYFGAHTYERVDREGTFHTDWAGDRAESEA